MDAAQHACRLMVYTSEGARAGHRGAWEALLERAREDGLRGATVWRGIEGFGASGQLRTSRFPDTAAGLPLVVEIVDHADRVDAFLPVVAELAPDALVTTEVVQIARRRRAGATPLDDAPPRR